MARWQQSNPLSQCVQMAIQKPTGYVVKITSMFYTVYDLNIQYVTAATRGPSFKTMKSKHWASMTLWSSLWSCSSYCLNCLTTTIADENVSDVTKTEMFMDEVMHSNFIHIMFCRICQISSSLSDASSGVSRVATDRRPNEMHCWIKLHLRFMFLWVIAVGGGSYKNNLSYKLTVYQQCNIATLISTCKQTHTSQMWYCQVAKKWSTPSSHLEFTFFSGHGINYFGRPITDMFHNRRAYINKFFWWLGRLGKKKTVRFTVWWATESFPQQILTFETLLTTSFIASVLNTAS